jgi:hypothetical protein
MESKVNGEPEKQLIVAEVPNVPEHEDVAQTEVVHALGESLEVEDIAEDETPITHYLANHGLTLFAKQSRENGFYTSPEHSMFVSFSTIFNSFSRSRFSGAL